MCEDLLFFSQGIMSFLTYGYSLVQVDYTTVFVFRLLMFVDNGLAAGMGLYVLLPFVMYKVIF